MPQHQYGALHSLAIPSSNNGHADGEPNWIDVVFFIDDIMTKNEFQWDG